MHLSEHFLLEELTHSDVALRRGLGNEPHVGEKANLARLAATLLEPARLLWMAPVHVSSGYRSPTVNHLVGGAANSQHMAGLAADVVPVGLDLEGAFHMLRQSSLDYDQIILECNSWIHLSIAPFGVDARREALTASGGPGNWTYERVA